MKIISRARRRAGLAAFSFVLALAALAPGATTSFALIMRDGGVCDPIRHMGC